VQHSDFGELQEAVLEGYRRHRSLAQRDVDLLADFLLVRGMAVIGWFYQRPEQAGSEDFDRVRDWVLEECASR
jgi:Ser/Thr protein kinase RdoA (MazF antagonist)